MVTVSAEAGGGCGHQQQGAERRRGEYCRVSGHGISSLFPSRERIGASQSPAASCPGTLFATHRVSHIAAGKSSSGVEFGFWRGYDPKA